MRTLHTPRLLPALIAAVAIVLSFGRPVHAAAITVQFFNVGSGFNDQFLASGPFVGFDPTLGTLDSLEVRAFSHVFFQVLNTSHPPRD
jgi:hypothetical protein